VKGLITLVMKGRMQAIATTVVAAVLGLLLAPLAIVSAAVVVLATLRNGAREGITVVLSAALAMAGLGGLLFGMPAALAILGLMLWLPAWGLGLVLGRSGSLARALEFAAIGGLLLIAFQYLMMSDPSQFWLEMLKAQMEGHIDPSVMSTADQQQLLKTLAGWMPGGVASSWTLSMSLAVMLGRWAQALLDRPGAFGAEFREFRCSKPWLIVLPLLLVPTFLMHDGTPGPASQLYLVCMTLFLLQGISVAHGLVHRAGANRGWLFGLYFLLLLAAPHSVTAIAAAGYADGWLNFRARVGSRPGGPQGPA
jgi:hypothetical protein